MDQEKRQLRKLKREIKNAGNKKRRQQLKRDLMVKPEEAHESEFEFGRDTSTAFNGMDTDATRKKKSKDE